MIKLDKNTNLVILDAIESCSEADPLVIKNDTGKNIEEFVKLKEKYADLQNDGINEDDLSLVIAALQWMLVVKDDSDILQIHKDDGLRLLELLSQKKNEISESAWSLHSV